MINLIDWKHPLVCGNPLMMGFMWQMAIVNTLVEAQYPYLTRRG
jgi:hypothetical protein